MLMTQSYFTRQAVKAAILLLLFLGGTLGLATKSKNKKNAPPSSAGKGFGAAPEQPSFLHTPDTSESIQALLQFCNSNKAKGVDQGVAEIGIKDGRRGLFARAPIKKDQIICMIPSDLGLALSDPAKMGEDAPTFCHGGLALLQMYMNNPTASKLWAPYLNTLPTRDSSYFTPTPDFFSDEEIDLLEFPRLINNIKQRKEDLQKLSRESGISFDELQFATWLVSSRAFNIKLSDESATNNEEDQYDERGQVIAKAGAGLKSIRVMIPFLDMANHDTVSPNCRFTIIDPEKDEAWFSLEANRNIPAGRELRIAYRGGVYSSVELLLNYGFVSPENKVDNFMLKKGGDDTISSLEGWSTTLEEDQSMLNIMKSDEVESNPLKKILLFRTKLKEAYSDL